MYADSGVFIVGLEHMIIKKRVTVGRYFLIQTLSKYCHIIKETYSKIMPLVLMIFKA